MRTGRRSMTSMISQCLHATVCSFNIPSPVGMKISLS